MPFHCGRIVAVLLSCASLAACGHSVETSSTIVMPAYYALQSQKGVEAVTTPGFVSRYERHVIVTGGPDGQTDCAKNFDGIMDHLETLMAPQIRENNEIAAQQAATRYTFQQ